jgi:cysteine desulfurase family protein (TIGR01976 family)
MSLDLDFVRAQFPAFEEPASRDLAFFENAGGSYPCRQVVDRLTRFYRSRKVQPYGHYSPSREGGSEMDEARARLAAMMNVRPDEMHFGPSTSQNTYVLAEAFRGWMLPGEAIVVTDQDHEANTGVWRRLAAAGIDVREWKMDRETGHLDPAALDRLLDGKVRLVCFPHVSNVVGEINDVAAIVARVHAAGAVACVDGVAGAPHGLPDIAALRADIYLFSTYKTYGPHQGIMVLRADLCRRLPSQGHFFNAGTLTKRFTPAGPDHAQIAACAGIADYFDALFDHHVGGDAAPHDRTAAVSALMHAQEQSVLAPLLDWLCARNSVRVLGTTDVTRKAPTVAIALREDPHSVAHELAARGVAAGAGDFYAVRPLKALGVNPKHGVLRLSFVHYTTAADVDRLIAALDQAL